MRLMSTPEIQPICSSSMAFKETPVEKMILKDKPLAPRTQPKISTKIKNLLESKVDQNSFSINET